MGQQRRAAVAMTALAVVLAGCSGAPPAPPPAAPTGATGATAPTTAQPSVGPPVAGMTAAAYRTRTDVAAGGRFQVQVHNIGDTPFTVVGATLDSPGFEALPVTVKNSRFNPGTLTDLSLPIGTAVCTTPLTPGTSYARLDIVRPDGGNEAVRVPLAEPQQDLTRMQDEQCAAAEIARQVSVTFDDLVPGTVDGAPVLTGTLRLVRAAADGPVAVTDVLGSVVLQVRPAQTLPAELAAEADTLTVPLVIRQATCDPHYLSETKQPVLFPLWLSFGGGEPTYSTVPVSETQRGQLITYLGDVCS